MLCTSSQCEQSSESGELIQRKVGNLSENRAADEIFKSVKAPRSGMWRNDASSLRLS